MNLERPGDAEIRAALHRKKFNRYNCRPDVLVVDELGLAHARSRIDVAVINGTIHGYEIKSDKDTLNRFDAQLATYRKTLGRLTFVCAPRHLSHVLAETPAWCGVIEASTGSRSAVHFRTHRTARQNPELDSFMLAHLLWKSEATSALASQGVEDRQLRKPRRELYEMLADLMTPREIATLIRSSMASRIAWRDRPIRVSYGG